MDIIQFVVNIIALLLFLFIYLFRSYSSEKGKNLATKEDIEEITHKIESVKSELQFQTQNKLTTKNAERDALINLYEKYYLYLVSITDTQFPLDSTPSKLNQTIYKLDELETGFLIAKARTELFIINDELETLTSESLTLTQKIHFQAAMLSIKLQQLQMKRDIEIQENPGEKTYFQNEYFEEGKNLQTDYITKKFQIFEQIKPLNERLKLNINQLICN